MKYIWSIICDGGGSYYAIETPPENIRPKWSFIKNVSGRERWYPIDLESRKLKNIDGRSSYNAVMLDLSNIPLPEENEIVVVTQEIVQNTSYYTQSV